MIFKRTKRKERRLLALDDVNRLHLYSVKVRDGLTYNIVNRKAVILELDTGFFYSLDELGTVVWESLQTNKVLSAVLQDVSRLLRIGRKDLAPEVIESVNLLVSERLVELNDEGI